MHEPRVHQLFGTGNNWLTVCPFATDGEMLCPKDYHESEVCGTFYVVEHGLDISNEMHRALRVEFTRGGEILRYLEQDAVWQRQEKAGSSEASESLKQAGSLGQDDSEKQTGNPGKSQAVETLQLPQQGAAQSNDRTDSKPYGSYTLNGDSRITFSLNGVSYEGVIVQLNDEAGNPTMCITGVGANQSAWAVKYI
jgi:hypothetical protein